MNLKQIDKHFKENIFSSKVMNRSLAWFFYAYKRYKWDLEDFLETTSYSEDPKIDEMMRTIRLMSLNTHLFNMWYSLVTDKTIIFRGECRGEKIRIKDPEKETKIRDDLLKEVEKEKKIVARLEKKHSEVKSLKAENKYLKERIQELENRKVY